MPYVHPNEETVAARHRFLGIIEREYPEVLESLWDDVLPHYVTDGGTRDEATNQWARKFNLTKDDRCPPWLDSQVHRTLRHWDQYPHANSQLPFQWRMLVPFLGDRSDMRLPPDLASLRLDVESDHAETASEVRNRWYAEVDAHLERLRRHAENEGMQPVDEYKRLGEHYHWAVRFQVGGEDAITIADDSTVRVDDRTVRRAIKPILEKVGLDQRKEPRGPGRDRIIRKAAAAASTASSSADPSAIVSVVVPVPTL